MPGTYFLRIFRFTFHDSRINLKDSSFNSMNDKFPNGVRVPRTLYTVSTVTLRLAQPIVCTYMICILILHN